MQKIDLATWPRAELLLGYLVTEAVNAVENFRYTIRHGEIWLLDARVPSLTDLKPGSQQFHIVTLPKKGTLET